MAVLQPRTLGELMSVHGIGPAKADRYGRGFLDTVARVDALRLRRALVPDESMAHQLGRTEFSALHPSRNG